MQSEMPPAIISRAESVESARARPEQRPPQDGRTMARERQVANISTDVFARVRGKGMLGAAVLAERGEGNAAKHVGDVRKNTDRPPVFNASGKRNPHVGEASTGEEQDEREAHHPGNNGREETPNVVLQKLLRQRGAMRGDWKQRPEMDRLQSQVSSLIRLALANQSQHEDRRSKRNARVEIQAPSVGVDADPNEAFEEQYEHEIAAELATGIYMDMNQQMERHYEEVIDAYVASKRDREEKLLAWGESKNVPEEDEVEKWKDVVSGRHNGVPKKGQFWERAYLAWTETTLPEASAPQGGNGKSNGKRVPEDILDVQFKIEDRYHVEIARVEQLD